MPMPWKALLNWKPFQIDALGLVTLLGAEEINAAIGRLVPSRYFEYFPFLGAFVIAGDRFKEKKPSFNLYNITQGFHTTDMSCWLTRWMLAQSFEKDRSIVHFEVADEPRSQWKQRLLAASLSFVFTGMLLVMTILSEDWYGIANVTAMIISILVRTYVLEANRWAIDAAIVEATAIADKNPDLKEDKKCMVVMSDSKAVTLEIPGHLIVAVFVDNPRPDPAWIYHFVRWIGWGAFAVHVLAIGQTKLANQLYSVVLIVVPTVLVCWKLGCDDSKWAVKFKKFFSSKHDEPVDYTCWFGSRLKAHVFQWPVDYEFTNDPEEGEGLQHTTPELDQNPAKNKWFRRHRERGRGKTRRQDLYAWLNLTPDELESMGKWDLFPHERGHNQAWWRDYKVKNALIQDGPYHLDTVSRTRRASQSNQSNGTAHPLPPPRPSPMDASANTPSNGTPQANPNNNITTNTNPPPTQPDGRTHMHINTSNLSNRSSAIESYEMDDFVPTGITRRGTDTVITPDGRVRQITSPH